MKTVTYDDTKFVLVPYEPTQEMIDWAFNNHAGAPVETLVIKPIWKEMLDHAPAISAPPETGAAIQNHAVCYVCGAPSFCAVNVLLGAAGGATLMRPVCDKHNPYSFVHPATDAEAAAAEIVARLQEAGHIPGEKANDWWIDIVVAIIKKHGAPAVGVAELEILMAKWQEELTVVDGWGSRGYTNAELLQRCSKELSAIIRGKK